MVDQQDTAIVKRKPQRAVLLEDDRRLAEMGYPRRLSRKMSGFDNFAISFTIISILTGCMTLLGYGMTTGGPAVIVWGWFLVGGMTVLVGLAMADLASAFPTSGALYYWSAKLAKRNGARWSWYTGWLNVIGQLGGTAGIDFGLAVFLQAFLAIEWGYTPTAHNTMLIYAGLLLVHGLANTGAVRLVALLNRVSVYWHVLGVALIVGALAIKPAMHQTLGFVLTKTANATGFSHFWYVAAIGLLLGGYTFCGFDASGHVSEETQNAAISAPRGIVRSIVVSWVVGLVLLLGFMFAIQNYNGEVGSATGVPPFQIMIDALGVPLAKVLLLVTIIAQAFCGMSSVTANSRLIFALSRDGVLPGSARWSLVSKRTRTPVAAVWLAVCGAFVLAVPYLWSPTAFTAITSVNVIGLFAAYGIPIFLRLRAGDAFIPGPWSLGRWGRPVSRLAVGWIAIEMVLFVLPETSPVTAHSFNYAGVAVGAVLVLATVWWVMTARRTYRGPVSYGTVQELLALESEMA
jgi:amino acid transporter